jgi:hypothetical protein
MQSKHTTPSNSLRGAGTAGDIASGTAAALAGLGVLTVALFPISIPILLLTVAFTVPLVIFGAALLLPVALVAAAVVGVRRLGRLLWRRPSARRGRALAAAEQTAATGRPRELVRP